MLFRCSVGWKGCTFASFDKGSPALTIVASSAVSIILCRKAFTTSANSLLLTMNTAKIGQCSWGRRKEWPGWRKSSQHTQRAHKVRRAASLLIVASKDIKNWYRYKPNLRERCREQKQQQDDEENSNWSRRIAMLLSLSSSNIQQGGQSSQNQSSFFPNGVLGC